MKRFLLLSILCFFSACSTVEKPLNARSVKISGVKVAPLIKIKPPLTFTGKEYRSMFRFQFGLNYRGSVSEISHVDVVSPAEDERVRGVFGHLVSDVDLPYRLIEDAEVASILKVFKDYKFSPIIIDGNPADVILFCLVSITVEQSVAVVDLCDTQFSYRNVTQ